MEVPVAERALFVDRPSLLLVETVERGAPSIALNAAAISGLCELDPQLFRLFMIGNEDALV
jgi:hypothetical protein